VPPPWAPTLSISMLSMTVLNCGLLGV